MIDDSKGISRRGLMAMLAAGAPLRAADALDLAAMRARYRKDLFDDYLPFHDRYVVDKEFGGFLCTVRPNGELVSDQKTTWYEGRGTWVYSFLYNHFGRNPRHLEIARGSVELQRKSRPADPNRMRPRALTRHGEPAGPPDPEVYSDLFAAEGFAEFSRASGQRQYWDEAKAIVLKCVRHFDREDYHPDIGKTYLGPSARPFPGARVLGVWMVLLRATTQMLALRADRDLQAISDRAVDAVLRRHHNPRFQLLNELINHDLSRPANEYEQLVYAGHAVETLWMLMDEALRRKDTAMYSEAAAMFRRHCEVSRDRVHGGLFRNLMNVDQNSWSLDKTLFPHQEALIGSLMMIEQTGDAWAREFHEQLDRYTRQRFPLRSIGSPLWQVTGNRLSDPTPEMTRAENYHHPRFLMLNLLAVERMIARGGKPLR